MALKTGPCVGGTLGLLVMCGGGGGSGSCRIANSRNHLQHFKNEQLYTLTGYEVLDTHSVLTRPKITKHQTFYTSL